MAEVKAHFRALGHHDRARIGPLPPRVPAQIEQRQAAFIFVGDGIEEQPDRMIQFRPPGLQFFAAAQQQQVGADLDRIIFVRHEVGRLGRRAVDAQRCLGIAPHQTQAASFHATNRTMSAGDTAPIQPQVGPLLAADFEG